MSHVLRKLFFVSLATIFSSVLFASNAAAKERPFVVKVQIKEGNDKYWNRFFMPLNPKYHYDFKVDCGSAKSRLFDEGKMGKSCLYEKPGVYTISITGKYPAPVFGEYGDRDNYKVTPEKLIEVVSWGDRVWESMEGVFTGCYNLEKLPKKAPNLKKVRSMARMFRDIGNFNPDVSNWDVSNVEDMSYMFSFARKFNRDLSKWNVSSVVNMKGMFFEAYEFNGDISSWNVSNVVNMNRMFFAAYSFNGDISNWDVSNVVNMNRMFDTARSFNQNLSNWKVNANVEHDNFAFAASKFQHWNYPKWNDSVATELEEGQREESNTQVVQGSQEEQSDTQIMQSSQEVQSNEQVTQVTQQDEAPVNTRNGTAPRSTRAIMLDLSVGGNGLFSISGKTSGLCLKSVQGCKGTAKNAFGFGGLANAGYLFGSFGLYGGISYDRFFVDMKSSQNDAYKYIDMLSYYAGIRLYPMRALGEAPSGSLNNLFVDAELGMANLYAKPENEGRPKVNSIDAFVIRGGVGYTVFKIGKFDVSVKLAGAYYVSSVLDNMFSAGLNVVLGSKL